MQIESGYIKHDGKSIVFEIMVSSSIIISPIFAISPKFFLVGLKYVCSLWLDFEMGLKDMGRLQTIAPFKIAFGRLEL